MFLANCFIRKNTPEIKKKLESLGIIHNVFDKEGYPWTVSNFGMHMSIPELLFSKKGQYSNGSIDCGTDEEMFFALAALCDDTDKDQLFIYDNTAWATEEEKSRFWFKCPTDKVEECMAYDLMFNDCRKATAKEIIHYFMEEEKNDYFRIKRWDVGD